MNTTMLKRFSRFSRLKAVLLAYIFLHLSGFGTLIAFVATNIAQASKAVVNASSGSQGPVTYGSTIRLIFPSMPSTALHSHRNNYYHPTSSRQQQVTGSLYNDNNDLWIVRGPDQTPDSYQQGQQVKSGDIIRLSHKASGGRLHNHLSLGQLSPDGKMQEVTGVGGSGNEGDEWIVTTQDGGPWTSASMVTIKPIDTIRRYGSSVPRPNPTAGRFLTAIPQTFDCQSPSGLDFQKIVGLAPAPSNWQALIVTPAPGGSGGAAPTKAPEGILWGANTNLATNNVYFRSLPGGSWQQVGPQGTQLSQLSIGANGAMWGVNVNDQIYYRTGITESNPIGSGWQLTSGLLINLSVDAKGNVWGVNRGGKIYYGPAPAASNPGQVNWVNVPGEASRVSVGANGAVWAIGLGGGAIYYRPGITAQTPTGTAASASANWQQVNGALVNIAVCPNGDLWGVNSAGQIYYGPAIFQGSSPAAGSLPTRVDWVNVPGALTQVSVDPNGNVWGVNAAGNIYYRSGITASTPMGTGWTQIDGKLTWISAGTLAPTGPSAEDLARAEAERIRLEAERLRLEAEARARAEAEKLRLEEEARKLAEANAERLKAQAEADRAEEARIKAEAAQRAAEAALAEMKRLAEEARLRDEEAKRAAEAKRIADEKAAAEASAKEKEEAAKAAAAKAAADAEAQRAAAAKAAADAEAKRAEAARIAAEEEARKAAAAQKAEAERVAAEKLAAEKLAAEKAAEKARLDKEAADAAAAKLAADKAAAEASAAQKAAADAAAAKAAADAAAAKAAADKAAADKAAADRAAAEKAIADKAAADAAAAEKARLDKAAADAAAAKAAADAAAAKAAADKIAADKAAAQKAAADKAASDAAALKASQADKAAADKAAADAAAAIKAASDAAAAKAAADAAAAKAAADAAAAKAAADAAEKAAIKADDKAIAKEEKAAQAINAPVGFDQEDGATQNMAVGARNDALEIWAISLNGDGLERYDTEDLTNEHPWVDVPANDASGKPLAQPLKMIALSLDGIMCVLDGNGAAHQYDWDKKVFNKMIVGAAGALECIAAGNTDNIWAADADTKQILRYDLAKGWQVVQGVRGIYVAAGLDDTVMVIDDEGSVWNFDGISAWTMMPSANLDRIAVGDSINVWGINDGMVYQYINGGWVRQNGDNGKPVTGFIEVFVDDSGVVWLIDNMNRLWQNLASAYVPTAATATPVSTTDASTPPGSGGIAVTSPEGAPSEVGTKEGKKKAKQKGAAKKGKRGLKSKQAKAKKDGTVDIKKKGKKGKLDKKGKGKLGKKSRVPKNKPNARPSKKRKGGKKANAIVDASTDTKARKKRKGGKKAQQKALDSTATDATADTSTDTKGEKKRNKKAARKKGRAAGSVETVSAEA